MSPESLTHAIWPHYSPAILESSGRFARVREALDGWIVLDPGEMPDPAALRLIARTLDELAYLASARNLRSLADLIEEQTTPPVKVPDNQRVAELIRYHLANESISAGDRAELAAFADYLTANAVARADR